MIWDIENLAVRVSERMSPYRFRHTEGVLEMARLLSDFCLPEYKLQISVAAILHDVTKELTYEQQLSVLREHGFELPYSPEMCPQVLHSFSAPFVIKKQFPEYATDEILSAVKKHTTGAEKMSIFDEIIFIADYAEVGRTYSQCIQVREFLLSSMELDNQAFNRNVLHRACIMAIENTISNLTDKGSFIAPEVYAAKKAILAKIL